MRAWHDVPWGQDVREYFRAVMKIREGSKEKRELHKATGLLLADRLLYSAVHYPANYGVIPQSYCADGDPLDVLVLSQVPLAPLSIARCRAIGAIRMRMAKTTRSSPCTSTIPSTPTTATFRSFLRTRWMR